MPLKQKIILSFLFLLLAGLVIYYFQHNTRVAEATAKIRIETKLSDTGESLILTQAKGVTQQSTMEELLRRLGEYGPSQEENQRKILDIQKHVKVLQQGNAEIFNIQVKHKDAKWAREIASQLAQSFKVIELQKEREAAESYEKDLERQAVLALKKIDERQLELKKTKQQNTPTDIDIALAEKLRENEGEYRALSQMYKDTHPDIVEVNKQIDSLRAQILDGPPLDGAAVKSAENLLREADAAYRNLRQKLDDAGLEKQKIVGNVQIIELSSATSAKKQQIPSLYFLFLFVVIGLSIFLRVTFR